MYVYSFLTGCS